MTNCFLNKIKNKSNSTIAMCGFYADFFFFFQGRVFTVTQIPRIATADILLSIRALGNWQ